MVQRKMYMEKLIKAKDKNIIKVITGVRRCGKSTLLMLYQEYLKQCGISEERIVSVNFEDVANEVLLDYRKLHQYIAARLDDKDITYVFLDEVQNVAEFQKAVDSLFLRAKIDIYITGSNAYMLSGELATLLSGRYIEIQMLPLSFSEYYELVGGDRREAWAAYYKNGGFPYAASIEDKEIRSDYISGIYSTVLLKDIVSRKRISDVTMLESIIKFLADNIGNIVSSKKIADSLTSYGRKTSSVTVENYIRALSDAFILYRADRYDVKGKQYLKSLEKYYIVDLGFRTLLLGDSNTDVGHILENIVYLELIRRGYKVYIGKIEDKEIDFVAEKNGDKEYYQVAATVLDPNTFAREIAPLKMINDNYPKYILSMDEMPMGEDGIKQVNVLEFLLT